MPTDLTGTPTSLGIGTYNTSADAPSGLGFNEAMAQIDALIAARAKIVGTPTNGEVPVWNSGTSEWEPGSIASGPGAPATTLPASPSDGQQAILTDSTATPTYAWLMQYSSAASKWLFIGGAPAFSYVSTNEGTTSSTYINFGTDQAITLARAGSYIIHAGGQVQSVDSSGFCNMGYKVGAAAAADLVRGHTTTGMSLAASQPFTALAGDAVHLQVRTSGSGGTASWNQRFMSITPVMVT